jgi:hypothetical protein
MSKPQKYIYPDAMFSVVNKLPINEVVKLASNSNSMYALMTSPAAEYRVWRQLFELIFPNQQKNNNETYIQAILRNYLISLDAIGRNGNNFAHLSFYLRNDDGFVRAAIRQVKMTSRVLYKFRSSIFPLSIIRNASDRVRNDKSLVSYALEGVKMQELHLRRLTHRGIVSVLGEDLQRDRDFLVNKLGIDSQVVEEYAPSCKSRIPI